MVTQDQSNSLSEQDNLVDQAVAEGGAYEIIRKRLLEQGTLLSDQAQSLNAARIEEFGNSDMDVLARLRVRTENNCIARDIVQIGENFLFGYNVFIGLKKETKISDVFAIFSIKKNEDRFEMTPISRDKSFLSDPIFVNDFEELYRYYKNAKLLQLSIINGKLLAGFQIGEKLEDVRVFRWAISTDGSEVNYIDNRGERDLQLPPPYDFEWIDTTRDNIVHNRDSHINIVDTLFVSIFKGSLTLKTEDNTETGQTVYKEQVDEPTQSLDDLKIAYAQVGKLILLKVLPYRENQWRYLVFNYLTQQAYRFDAVGESCVQLPEDHGIIFPGGYYLESGEHKHFSDADGEYKGLKFKRRIRSPNGEDVLYVFYEPENGAIGLFAYNIIEKSLSNPIYGHGYALFENGYIVIFSAEQEPTRIHPMQLWQTPFSSAEYASKTTPNQNFFGKIGNAELVRGISDIYSIIRIINDQSVSLRLYEELNKAVTKIFDNHYWVSENETKGLDTTLKKIADTSELVVDEFEKVESIRQQSNKVMEQAEQDQASLIIKTRSDSWDNTQQFVDALSTLRHQRGHLTTIKEYRYIDLNRIDELDKELSGIEKSVSEKTILFLTNEKAFTPYQDKLEQFNKNIAANNTNAELKPTIDEIEKTAAALDLLSELMSTLKIEDATVRTRIIDSISDIYSKLNQSKAQAKNKQKNLGSTEAIAQFSAQFKLFSLSITNALGLSTTPERCDEQLSKLLVRLEELESQFSDYETFLSDIISKREEIYQSFESHKQQLLDEQQRKALAVKDAADRILSSIEKRSLTLTSPDELNTYFVSDGLVNKIRELIDRLRILNSAIQADEVESKLSSIKEQAIRSLRDKKDIYEEGGKVIKLGPRHKFSVNTQELDLTIIPRDNHLNIHLTGTHFYQTIEKDALFALKDYWNITLASESETVYRSEHLAASILRAAKNRESGLSVEKLNSVILNDQNLHHLVKDYAAPLYKEGYEKGIHDHDAALILKKIMPALKEAKLLQFNPFARGLSQLFWASIQASDSSISFNYSSWHDRAKSAQHMQYLLNSNDALTLLTNEINEALLIFVKDNAIEASTVDCYRSASYLTCELSRDKLEFVTSKYALTLVETFKSALNDQAYTQYQSSIQKLSNKPYEQWMLTNAWLHAIIKNKNRQELAHYVPEAIALINTHDALTRRVIEADLEISVSHLLGNHPLIKEQCLSFSLDVFLQKTDDHHQQFIPQYQHYLSIKKDIIEQERHALRLEEFKPKPLSSFVRNKLINDAYLPIIGDNLAKQMGTIGENKRSDLMGLLMMISPPGYGKTTLMEYVASRLGLIFMKINCPSLGHDVLSLDPEQAPNATAKQELLKLNLSLEMGNNVMLYLDDIQHTHPEFLQKFISLCDGTRRIEGIWKNKTKTYDMRGRKFCVVMAGNPYTESGEVFKVPDMLANRADIYNLGDILGGMDEQFALSYIENSLTSNAVLAPLALRELNDVYKFVDMAKGKNIATTELSHQYSRAEINEITEVLKKLFIVQDIVLKINQQYILSAAQNDDYRTEPAFKLQGSYRNMNKMAEKVSAVMNHDELMSMISDHYLGESQLLTSGAEDNLLKLAELRDNLTTEQAQRWKQIKEDFLRNKAIGGKDTDTGAKVVAQLVDITKALDKLSHVTASHGESFIEYSKEIESTNTKNEIHSQTPHMTETSHIADEIKTLIEQVDKALKEKYTPLTQQALLQIANKIDIIIKPMIKKIDKKLSADLRTYFKINELTKKIHKLENRYTK